MFNHLVFSDLIRAALKWGAALWRYVHRMVEVAASAMVRIAIEKYADTKFSSLASEG